MAVFNILRGRARLSQAEFGVACALGTDPQDPLLHESAAKACLQSLAQAGLVENGRLGGYLGEIVTVVLAPKLRVLAEATVGRATGVHSVWADESLAVLGAVSGEDEIELMPMETTMLPWSLALTVGLGSRPRPPLDAPVELRSSALDRASGLVAENDREGARKVLSSEAGMPPARATVIADLLERQHISWRASSVWTGADGREQTRTVTVIDGGTAGLWFSWSPAQETPEPPEDPVVTLTPTTAKEAWSRLVDLFPSFPEPFQEISAEDSSRG